jgi:photosystem II stability/assembly factor-like uncharacterized protein
MDWPTASSPFLIGTDVGGGYRWNASTLQWDALITTTSMPIGYAGHVGGVQKQLGGLYGIASAPTDPTRIYMMYGVGGSGGDGPHNVFISNDVGTTFTIPAGWISSVLADPNNAYKFQGPKVAVDPINKDICYVASPQNGIFFTKDAGASAWIAPSGVTTPRSTPCAIIFDPHGGTIAVSGQTRTKNVWINSPGYGVYNSIDGGVTWSLITGSATDIGWIKVCPVDGIVYACNNASSGWTKVYRIIGTTFADITNVGPTSSGSAYNIVPSLFTAGDVAVINQSGAIYWSTNANNATAANVVWTGQGGANTNVTAADVPWLAMGGKINYISVGDAIMDPGSSGLPKIYEGGGTGVWWTTTHGGTSSPAFNSQTKGIDELITTWIVSPPGGKPIITQWDRPVFTITDPDVYPSSYGPDYPNLSVNAGWSCDWATTDPKFLVVGPINFPNGEHTCYSTDSGATWHEYGSTGGKAFPTQTKNGGCIAASTPSNVVFAWSNNSDIYSTTDAGANWKQLEPLAFRDGGVISGVRAAADVTMKVLAVATSSGAGGGNAGNILMTVDTIGTLATNDQASSIKLPGVSGYSNSNQITVIDSTHVELQRTSGFTGTLTSIGRATITVTTGWGYSYYNARQSICADRVTDNKFYAYSNLIAALGGGIYKSTDGGLNWTRTFRGSVGAQTENEKLRSVPHLTGSVSTTGHLFLHSGRTGGGSRNGNLRRSTNEGGSWTSIANVNEPYAVGFGAVKPGNDYPSVYLIGYVNSIYGFWRSDSSSAAWTSNRVTWTMLGNPYPFNSTDFFDLIEGDANVYGMFYVGGQNRCFYGKLV